MLIDFVFDLVGCVSEIDGRVGITIIGKEKIINILSI